MRIQSNQCSYSNLESIAICFVLFFHYEMYLFLLMSSCSPSGSFLFSLYIFVPPSCSLYHSLCWNSILGYLKCQTDRINTKCVSGRSLLSECVVRLYIKNLTQWNERQSHEMKHKVNRIIMVQNKEVSE